MPDVLFIVLLPHLQRTRTDAVSNNIGDTCIKIHTLMEELLLKMLNFTDCQRTG